MHTHTLAPLFHACQDCKNAPVYRVDRLWGVTAHNLEPLQCCEAHKPGTKKGAPIGVSFYRLTPLEGGSL